ncbi:MAG: hypothetical protein HY682_00800 [Chloroflexi bacterium]|nr:hypothetical protein [Chloroflexota bacterium]
MYEQERLQQQFPEEAALAEKARAVASAASGLLDRVRQVIVAIAEPFGAPMQIENLEPKVRAGMSPREKGISDAYLHGA